MSTSPGAQALTTRCTFCGEAQAVARIFMDGPRSRYRTWRYVDFLRPVNRAIWCLTCGYHRDQKTVIFKKSKPEVEIRKDRVEGIRRLKAAGWTLFEGDTRWSR